MRVCRGTNRQNLQVIQSEPARYTVKINTFLIVIQSLHGIVMTSEWSALDDSMLKKGGHFDGTAKAINAARRRTL